VIIFDFYHHHHPPDKQPHGTLSVDPALKHRSDPISVFSLFASISYEGNVDSVTSASSNIPKTQDSSLAVRGDHPTTIPHLYPLTFQLLADKTWVNNKNNANEYAYT